MPDADDQRAFGSRRGWSFGSRVRAHDSYGLLLLLILLSLIVSTLDTTSYGRLIAVARVAMLAGTLAFALHTSDAPRALVCAGLVLAALILSMPFDAGARRGGDRGDHAPSC